MSMELVWELAWKSVPLAALALLLPTLLSRRSAAERASIAHAAMVALMLLPLLALMTPRLELLPGLMTNRAAPAPAPAPLPVPEFLNTNPTFTESAAAKAPATKPISRCVGDDCTQSSAQPTAPPPRTAALPSAGQSRKTWLVLAYAAPTALLLLTLLAGLSRLTRLRQRADAVTTTDWLTALYSVQRQMGINRPVALMRSTELNSPISFGLRRPVILLDQQSSSLQPTDSQIDSLIAHELAHLARYDWVALILSRTVIAMYWFNPLVWLLARQCHQLREEAADDAVLRQRVTGADYASVLVHAARMQQQRLGVLAHGMASGQRSLKLRVQRVLNGHLRRAPAKALWSGACVLAMLTVAAPLAALSPTSSTPIAIAAVTPAAAVAEPAATRPSPLPLMSWTLRARKKDSDYPLQLMLVYTDGERESQTSRPIRPSELQGLDTNQLDSSQAVDVQFSLNREAGRLLCRGSAARLSGAGNCEFAPATDYADSLERKGVGRPSTMQQLELALQNVSLDLVDELHRQNYRDFDIRRLVEMGIHGVNRQWLQELDELGYRLDDVRQLVEFRIHGVSPKYIRSLAEIDPQYRSLKAKQLVEMRIHGVSAKFIRALAAADPQYRSVSAKQLIEMRIHGVGPDFINQLVGLGYRDLPSPKLVEMRIHGVTPEFINELDALGYRQLPPAKLVEMRIHGVTPALIDELASLGYRQISPSQLVEMRIHGVTPSFIRKQTADRGRELSISRLVEMRIHGA